MGEELTLGEDGLYALCARRFDLDEDEGRKLFAQYGDVVSLRILADNRLAFVRYGQLEEAEMCLAAMGSGPYQVAPAHKSKARKGGNVVEDISPSFDGLYGICARNVHGLSEAELRDIFSAFGEVVAIRMPRDGLAFIKYAEKSEALGSLNGMRNSNYLVSPANNPKRENNSESRNEAAGYSGSGNSFQDRKNSRYNSNNDTNEQNRTPNFNKQNLSNRNDGSEEESRKTSSPQQEKEVVQDRDWLGVVCDDLATSSPKTYQQGRDHSNRQSLLVTRSFISGNSCDQPEKELHHTDDGAFSETLLQRRLSEPVPEKGKLDVVIVANIPPSVDKSGVKQLLSKYNPVGVSEVDRTYQYPFCYVEMRNWRDAVAAEKGLNQMEFQGRCLLVLVEDTLVQNYRQQQQQM